MDAYGEAVQCSHMGRARKVSARAEARRALADEFAPRLKCPDEIDLPGFDLTARLLRLADTQDGDNHTETFADQRAIGDLPAR